MNIKEQRKIRFELRNLGRNVELIFADSQEYNKAKYNYLPGGIINCLCGNVNNLYNSLKTVISKLGNLTIFELSNEHKTILYITVYRILEGSTKGVYSLLPQYN